MSLLYSLSKVVPNAKGAPTPMAQPTATSAALPVASYTAKTCIASCILYSKNMHYTGAVAKSIRLNSRRNALLHASSIMAVTPVASSTMCATECLTWTQPQVCTDELRQMQCKQIVEAYLVAGALSIATVHSCVATHKTLSNQVGLNSQLTLHSP